MCRGRSSTAGNRLTASPRCGTGPGGTTSCSSTWMRCSTPARRWCALRSTGWTWLDRLDQTYGYTQPELHVHRLRYDRDDWYTPAAEVPNTSQAHADAYLRHPARLRRRRSNMVRAGADNLAELAVVTGYGTPQEFPGINHPEQLIIGAAHSWLGGTPAPRHGPDQVLVMVQHGISHLIWHLHNRLGDLNLVAIAPIIERLHDPARGWEAVIGFIFQSPELRMLVRRATYRELVNVDGGYGGEPQTEERTLDLPPSVRSILGIPDAGSPDQPTGEWIRGAFSADVPEHIWSSVSPRRVGPVDLAGTQDPGRPGDVVPEPSGSLDGQAVATSGDDAPPPAAGYLALRWLSAGGSEQAVTMDGLAEQGRAHRGAAAGPARGYPDLVGLIRGGPGPGGSGAARRLVPRLRPGGRPDSRHRRRRWLPYVDPGGGRALHLRGRQPLRDTRWRPDR